MSLRLVPSERAELDLPFDLETEQALLGVILVRGSLDPIGALVRPEHFSEDLHARVYAALQACAKSGKRCDLSAIRAEFVLDRALQEVGGIKYLTNCMAMVPGTTDAMFDDIARLVVSFAARREVVRAARDIEACAQDMPSEWDVEDLVQMAEGRVLRAGAAFAGIKRQRFESASAISGRVIDQMFDETKVESVRFGLTELDRLTAGMRPKEMIVVGARPGMGKTAFAMAVALRAARQGRAVAFFSMEMDAASLMRRALTSMAYEDGHNVAYEALRKGGLKESEKDALIKANVHFNNMPLWIHEGRDHKPSALLSEARRMQAQAEKLGTPLGLVVVDHIQKVVPERDAKGNKVAETTEVSDALQKMAGALNCPVMALSQLNRGVEGREDKRPELRDLRESGAIEQDADLVLLLHRESYYLKKKEPDRFKQPDKHNEWFKDYVRVRHQLDVQIAKQRSGPEDTVTIHFDAPTGAMKDW